jgi:cysteine desulfuration protein SufE
MTLRERQNQFIETIGMFDNWQEKFNFLIDYASLLPAECPGNLERHRIEFCQSRTCFKAENIDGHIHVDGWSNSAVTGGIIVALMKLFDGIPVEELGTTPIDFHEKSGQIDNLTPMRASSLLEMIRRIRVLFKP